MAIKFLPSRDPEMISKLRLYAAEKGKNAWRSCLLAALQKPEETFHLIKFQFPFLAIKNKVLIDSKNIAATYVAFGCSRDSSLAAEIGSKVRCFEAKTDKLGCCDYSFVFELRFNVFLCTFVSIALIEF